VFAVVCLCVCLSAVVAALVANKDIYKDIYYRPSQQKIFKDIVIFEVTNSGKVTESSTARFYIFSHLKIPTLYRILYRILFTLVD